MPSLCELLVACLLVLGTFLMLVTGIGLVRFPDAFCRMHAGGKAGTLGVVCLILGSVAAFAGTDQDVTFRGLLAVVFQFLTTPAATHLLARAAYLCDYPRWQGTELDELHGYLPARPDEVFNKE
jgi:multicomponent Na+:H+ antiporter subunit G